MEKVKVRIEPITAKEAAQRDDRLLEFLTDDNRIQENSWAGNYRSSLSQAKQLNNELKGMYFA